VTRRGVIVDKKVARVAAGEALGQVKRKGASEGAGLLAGTKAGGRAVSNEANGWASGRRSEEGVGQKVPGKKIKAFKNHQRGSKQRSLGGGEQALEGGSKTGATKEKKPCFCNPAVNV